MKITELEIEGFRSFHKTTWKPGALNVVIGRNGSGKSNLLQFLQLIAASSQGKLSDLIASSGGMNALVWDGRTNNISFKLVTSPIYPNLDPGSMSVTYEVTLTQLGKTSSYQIKNELLGNYHSAKNRGFNTPFALLERNGLSGRLYDEQKRALAASANAISETETLLSLTATPFLEKRYQQSVDYRQQLQSWAIYQDIRTDRNSMLRRESQVKAVKQVDGDGQNLVNVLFTLYQSAEDTTFRENIDDGIRAAFGDDYRELNFSPDAEGRVQLGIRWKSLRRVNSASTLSNGTLRFLFLLTVLANPNRADVIAIDEPELGLHPTMLPIIAEYAAEAARNSQVVFTTQSDQFLNAFKDTIPTTTVAIWRDGETYLQNLQTTELEVWLQEFTLGNLLGSGELENLALETLETVG